MENISSPPGYGQRYVANMRTSKYTIADVEHFAQYFRVLSHQANAIRSLHFQATSFYWSDEMPEFVDDGYDASIRHFMIWLLSYRKVLMYGESVSEFEPLWNRLIELCPNWPGFNTNRRDPILILELERETDDAFNWLERACNVRKRRNEHKRKLADRHALNGDGDAT
jgi:hypothetical protein